MWRLVYVVVLWTSVASQPVTDESESRRQTRNYDYLECCPCPSKQEDLLEAASFPHAGHFGRDLGQAVGQAGLSRGSVDDCPCRSRGADSEGSPSILFPTAMHPVRPFMRSDETKEDAKPLLHPEVGLASSVLQTLRDATDEEYQDALARDAARNEARVSELRDTVPETAKNVISIIVNPRKDTTENDAIPEASHLQETHCVHPLDPPKFGLAREADKTSRYKPYLKHSNFDMDSAASNVQEQVVGINKGLEGLKLKNPSVLKLLSKKPEERNIQSLLKLGNDSSSQDAKDLRRFVSNLGAKVPALKLPSWFEKDRLTTSLNPLKSGKPGINRLDILKLKRPLGLKPKLGRNGELDSNTAPSIQEQFSKTKNNVSPFNLRTLLPARNAESPLSLKNLLNLKDVEMITPKPFALPGFNKLLPHLRINKKDTDFSKRKKVGLKANKDCDNNRIGADLKSQSDQLKTKILDVLPAPSENVPVIDSVNSGLKSETVEQNFPQDSKNKKIKTQILDTMPSPSENDAVTSVVDINEDHTEASHPQTIQQNKNARTKKIIDALPIASENTEFIINTNENKNLDNDEDIENIQQKGKPETDSFSELSKNNKDNSEFIDGNEFGLEEFEEQSSDSISEIEIGGFTEGNQQIDFEFEDPDLNIEITNIGVSDVGSVTIEDKNMENTNLENDEEVSQVESNGDSSQEFRIESSNVPDEIEDAFADTTNQQEILLPAVDIQERGDVSSLEESFKSEQVSNEEQQLESESLHKNDIVLPVKEKLLIKLNTSKNPYTKIFTISRSVKPDVAQRKLEDKEKSAFSSDETTDIDSLNENIEQFPVNEKTADVDSQDMQNMSNNLLKLSRDQKGEEGGIENFEGTSDVDTDSDIISSDSQVRSGIETDMDSSATTNFENFDSSIQQSAETFQTSESNIESSNIDSKNDDKTCSADLLTPKINVQSAEDSLDPEENEMESGASAPFVNTLPGISNVGSPFLRQNIVQPSSIFDTSNMLPVQPLDVSNLNLHLPTLEEIQTGITNLLAGSARATEEDDEEFHSAEDCSDPLMDTGASTTSMKSSLPGLRPLENVNLDIFQINPLGQPGLKVPALNLKSFKTKLALPKAFDLTPMKLESRLGGKNGLVGAALTFGPQKIGGKGRKANPVSKLGSVLNLQNSDILGSPLSNMQSLEELSSKMRENAKSLINSPLSPLEDTLRTTHTLGNSLRTHTENTMRNIQQTLASTLNEARISDINNVGDKFAKPQDLLDHLSSAHEDMNDKLHAIHVDLQDRLSSIHDRITDQTNLSTLKTPLLSNLGRLEESPSRSTSNKGLSWVPESPPRRFTNKKLIATKKTAAKTRRPNSKGKIKLGSNTGKNTDEFKLKPFKMSKAASSLTPTRVEVPKLMTTSTKPPFSLPLARDDSVKLKEKRPLFGIEPVLRPRTQFKPFGEFKVSISTTPSPASFKSKPPSSRSQIGSKPSTPKPEQSDITRWILKPNVQSRLTEPKSFSTKPKAIGTSSLAKPIASKLSKTSSTSQKSPVSSRSKPEKSPVSPGSSLKSTQAKRTNSLLKLPSFQGVPALSLPKTTESPLLAKLRDSLRIRIDRPIHPFQTKGKTKSPGAHDMSRAASENNEVVIRTEPMKENVSYKCKMVCVRE